MPATWAYFDSSVLIKRYLEEPDSVRARELLRKYRVLSSIIAPLEAFSAFRRMRMADELSERVLATVLSLMGNDREGWRLFDASGRILLAAEEVIWQTGLRAL